jgi:hypothetical protein
MILNELKSSLVSYEGLYKLDEVIRRSKKIQIGPEELTLQIIDAIPSSYSTGSSWSPSKNQVILSAGIVSVVSILVYMFATMPKSNTCKWQTVCDIHLQDYCSEQCL